jgi:hypothetical protein
MWGQLKTVLYSAPTSDFVVLQQRAENASQEFGVKPGIVDRMRTSVSRRAGSFIEMHGKQVEHLLY